MPPIRKKCESLRAGRILSGSDQARGLTSLRFAGAKPVFLHGLAADEVPLDNLFERFLVAGMIPDAVRPDHGNRPIGANLKAIGLGPLDTAARVALRVIPERSGQVQLGKSPFEELPRTLTLLA